MAFTFNDDLSTDRDLVRARIGDIHQTNPIMQDATIDAYLVLNIAVLRTCIACVRFILGALARQNTRNVLGISGNIAEATANYQVMLADLMAESATDTGMRCPSISITQVDLLNEANGTTAVPPRFQDGMFDYVSDNSADHSPDWDEI